MRISDWSSDVCSSDLADDVPHGIEHREAGDHGEHLFAVEPLNLHLGFHGNARAQHRAVLHVDDLGLGMREIIVGGAAEHDLRLQAVEFHELLIGERSEEHTSELQSLMRISYSFFCLKKDSQIL